MEKAYAIGAAVALAGAGLALSFPVRNRAGRDSGGSLSRSLAGVVGGGAFLVQVLWLDAWTAVAVSGVLTLLVLAFRLHKKARGQTSRRPEQSRAEVTYALSGTASIAIAWGILGNKWLAFLPIAFMAWGDNAAGLARVTICRDKVASVWPSLGMLAVCLGCSALLQPWWVGAVGGVASTVIERYRPRLIRCCDDNPIVVTISLGMMTVILNVASGL